MPDIRMLFKRGETGSGIGEPVLIHQADAFAQNKILAAGKMGQTLLQNVCGLVKPPVFEQKHAQSQESPEIRVM
jgi:hypothetical protein